MFKVIIKDKEWLIPLSMLCKIGLLNDIYNCTNDMEVCLDMIEEDVFLELYKILMSNNINVNNISTIIKIIKLGDYLMCDSLVNDLCIHLSKNMENMSEAELKLIYGEWDINLN